MANALYDNGRKMFLEGQINWLTATIKCILVDTSAYAVQLTTHTTFGDIAPAAYAGGGTPLVPRTLLNKSTTGGAANADPVTFTSVGGPSLEAIVIYVDSGVPSTSYLIAYIDTATGLAITPNGGDIIITWDTGPNKIFKL